MIRPALAPDAGDDRGARRSLVLAGGGMRVAYQAGVLAALEEEGLRFHHADGASGGTINLSMLLSGLSVEEMCDRWRALDPRDFSAPLPLRDYLRSPHWPGIGSGSGLRDKVFPRLGIDVDRIRESSGIDGTYNVCNFSTKTAEVVEHTQVHEDLLVAAVSLPVLMPAVQIGDSAYTDAVWIRDSNVPEAVRRGSDEIWLVWCIGNTPHYLDGSFHQYVHMIEMAATGSLLADLGRLAATPDSAGVRLHVIKPLRPLPLDPDYFLGRIDGSGLVGLGYRDAREYLRNPRPLTAPWNPGVTSMLETEPGVAGPMVIEGSFSWNDRRTFPLEGPAKLHLRVQGPPPRDGTLFMGVVGDVTLPGWPPRRLIEHGTLRFGGDQPAELALEICSGGATYRIVGQHIGGRIELTVSESDTSDPARSEPIGRGMVDFSPSEVARFAGRLKPVGFSSAMQGWRTRLAATRTVWRAGP